MKCVDRVIFLVWFEVVWFWSRNLMFHYHCMTPCINPLVGKGGEVWVINDPARCVVRVAPWCELKVAPRYAVGKPGQ